VDSSNFAVSRTIAAALVELEPGALRELHWHPNADEWQYYIEGEGRMTVFGREQSADLRLPRRRRRIRTVCDGHYIENTGPGPLRFLEMFRSDRYADLSLNQWLALTPHILVDAHLKIDPEVVSGLSTAKVPLLPK
jgi:oxalate decarboxylase